MVICIQDIPTIQISLQYLYTLYTTIHELALFVLSDFSPNPLVSAKNATLYPGYPESQVKNRRSTRMAILGVCRRSGYESWPTSSVIVKRFWTPSISRLKRPLTMLCNRMTKFNNIQFETETILFGVLKGYVLGPFFI